MDQCGADDDRQLLEAFATQRDQAAFEQIVDRHAAWVFAAALRQLKDRHLAEDAVQIVFFFILGPDGKLLARDISIKDAAQILTQFLRASTQPSTNLSTP